ncbi:uncharacterized protein LOC122876407 [Siniperca chuatsi]|uniref:uncharacterized protein LOC122876407 n=1 Tax=Siniperca chuatsi TaxID=119488 RepID=UPI001CE09039|nr:uncharacterized protein LOC122876407 [Siniperca chuatsi]
MMDYEHSGLLSHQVLVLLLLEVQWRPVFLAPTDTSCDLRSTKSLTELVRHEANELLDKYTTFHGPINGLVDGVPDSTISGINISEKLQDIVNKNILFYLHISKVEEYQKAHWGNPESVAKPLTDVKTRLDHHLSKIQAILKHIIPEMPLPATPAPPQLSNDHDYRRKKYGWGVIDKLKDWLTKVLQVLEEAKEVCDKETAEI